MLLTAFCAGEAFSVEVAPGMRLGACQKRLCLIFKQRFPLMKASVRVGTELFDEFSHTPFLKCDEGGSIEVIFAFTDDPFFYDLRDRAPTHEWLNA